MIHAIGIHKEVDEHCTEHASSQEGKHRVNDGHVHFENLVPIGTPTKFWPIARALDERLGRKVLEGIER